MKVISLFSGAGISDVGFHQAGLECLSQVEIDKTASSVRRRHFPDTEHHEDIHEFNAIRFRGACDVVAGGFPCQDHSVAGRRGGLSGDRGALWWQMLRVIDEAQPDYVWGENVPGILSSDGGDAFRSIVNSLVQLGYSVAWRTLDLRYFGVPQRRRRVFIVGSRLASASRGRAGVRIFEPNCLPWNLETSREAGEGSAWVVGTLSANGGGVTRPAGNANEPDFCIPVAPTTYSIDMLGCKGQTNISTNIVQTLSAAGDAHAVLQPVYAPTTAGTIDSLSGVSGGMCNEKDFCVAFRWNASAAVGMEPSEISPTLKAAGISEPAVMQSARVRRLLPIEAERLMGLPDGYTEFGADGERISNSARYRMLGNGWAVPAARWLAERFIEVDGSNESG